MKNLFKVEKLTLKKKTTKIVSIILTISLIFTTACSFVYAEQPNFYIELADSKLKLKKENNIYQFLNNYYRTRSSNALKNCVNYCTKNDPNLKENLNQFINVLNLTTVALNYEPFELLVTRNFSELPRKIDEYARMQKLIEEYRKIYLTIKMYNELWFTNDIKFQINDQEYTIPISSQSHIFIGDYNEKFAITCGGCHTHLGLNLFESVCKKKLKNTPESLKNRFILEVLQGQEKPYRLIETFDNGVEKYEFLDSCDGARRSKTIFPKEWKNEKIIEAIKLCLNGKYKIFRNVEPRNDDTSELYMSMIDGVMVCVYVENNEVITAHPVGYKKNANGDKYILDMEDKDSKDENGNHIEKNIEVYISEISSFYIDNKEVQ